MKLLYKAICVAWLGLWAGIATIQKLIDKTRQTIMANSTPEYIGTN